MGLPSKAAALVKSGPELRDRVCNKLEIWRDRFSRPSTLRDVMGHREVDRGLSLLGVQIAHSDASRLAGLEDRLRWRSAKMAEGAVPFGTFHNGTVTLGRICYAACRALRPKVVTETGVAYGVTSAYILEALAENGEGELHSIDLPPLGPSAEQYVGYLIPQELRGRWKLHVGSARKLLPGVLRGAGGADIFIHDSLHTYGHMKMELAAALAALRPGGILIADDVEGNRAFEEALQDPRVESWFAIHQKDKVAICGAVRVKGR